MEPSRIAAFFDVDHTLLDANTGFRWARHQHRAGEVSTMNLLRVAYWLVRYRLTQLDHDSLIARVAETYAGTSVAVAEAEMKRWFEAEMLSEIRPVGRERVREHIEAGHVVALMSSGTRYTLTPLAEHLGIEHVIATIFEERDGLLTGRHEIPACAGYGKVVHAERFAAAHDIDLSASYAYTDSHADIELLKRVGRPVAVTPDRRLRREATRSGWPIEDWRSA